MFQQPISKTFFWLLCLLIRLQIKHLNTNLKYVLFIHRPVENFPLPPVINFPYCHSANRINASAPKKWCSMNLIFSKRGRSLGPVGPQRRKGGALRATARRTGSQGRGKTSARIPDNTGWLLFCLEVAQNSGDIPNYVSRATEQFCVKVAEVRGAVD